MGRTTGVQNNKIKKKARYYKTCSELNIKQVNICTYNNIGVSIRQLPKLLSYPRIPQSKGILNSIYNKDFLKLQ